MFQKIKKTVIFGGYKCNNKCIFCINWDKRDIPGGDTLQIKKEMTGAKARGSTYLEIIGGEPTIRPDIVELISFAKKLGFKTIMMSTNGRLYSYKEFAKKILQAGLNSIVFSIHGHTARLHDSLTQVPGSFDQLREGVKNVKEVAKELNLKISMGSNTCIVKQNYKYLPKIGEYIWSLGVNNAEFIFVDPNYGAAFKFFDKLVPKISQIAPYVQKCLDIGKKNKKMPAYAWQDLALRVIKELNIPDFKRSAVFKVCKQKSRIYIEKALNDTKELCQSGEKWKYFFKVIAGGKKKMG